MDRCPSCFEPSAGGALCAGCSARSRAETALPLGHSLREGRYRIGRTLGDPGGFGITYLGWDDRLERRVAIKEFFPRHCVSRTPGTTNAQSLGASADQDFRLGLEGFLNEARRLAKLDHPNIVKVHDYCEAHGTGYLVMNYYEGRDLSEYAKTQGGRLGWQEAMKLSVPLLDGLAEVHRAGLIHRDIKPANVYLAASPDGKGRPILIDFGAARWAATSHELTAILTEGFAPLEQYPGCGPQGPWTDIYAVAATIYALIAGQVPPSAPSRLAGAYVSHLTDLVAGVPRRLGDALEFGLAIQSEERPRSAEEFARLLRSAEAPVTSRVAGPPGLPGPPAEQSGGVASGRDALTQPVGASADAVAKEPGPTRVSGADLRPAARRLNSRALAWGVAALALVGVGVSYAVWSSGDSPSGPVTATDSAKGAAPGAENSGRGPGPSPTGSTPQRGAQDPAADARALIARATQDMNQGQYTEAMSKLARARVLFGEAGVVRETRLAGLQRVDSIAGVIESACPADRAIAVKFGEKRPPCPVRSW